MEVGGGETVERVRARLDDKSEYAVIRGTCVAIFFVALWAINLYVFKVAHIDISCIYPSKLAPGERPTHAVQPLCHPRKVVTLASLLIATLGLSTLFWSEVLGQPAAHSPLLFYFLFGAIIFYPLNVTNFFRDFFLFFWRVTWLVLWPGEEIHFLEVLVGDILTSLSKVFFEIGLTCVAFLLSYSSTIFTYISVDVIPTLLATAPFILRIRQCSVQFKVATSEKAKFQIILNILKYCSSIPGLWLPIILAKHYPTKQIEQVLLWVLLVNSIYSFLWDVIMDWGLGQCGARHWCLRTTLLFGTSWQYYGAILLDFVLRLVWVLKYVEFDHKISYDKFMLLIEVLEVLRRGIWSIYRIEWECLSISSQKAQRTANVEEKENLLL